MPGSAPFFAQIHTLAARKALDHAESQRGDGDDGGWRLVVAVQGPHGFGDGRLDVAREAQHAHGIDVRTLVDGNRQIMFCQTMKQGDRHPASMPRGGVSSATGL